jgi:hypothetical protein
MGYLLPDFHKAYWFGLVSNESFYPIFGWLDPLFPGPAQTDYRNWGTLSTAAGDLPEPNNQQPPEYCGACSASQARSGAWGWADQGCALSYVQMCRIQGAMGARLLGRAWPPASPPNCLQV